MTDFTQHIPPPCIEEVVVLDVDDHIVVISKPAGLLSVPGRYVKDSVLHRMLYEYADVAMVHRLDLDTSGLMVLARSKQAARELSRQFHDREIDKEYTAVLWGKLEESEGVIDVPLAPDPFNRPRHLVDPLRGKEAITHFRVTECHADRTRVSFQPRTGRSHQLRVHAAHIGHPILGCDLYAHPDAFSAAQRLLLHASGLSFTHPVHGARIAFTSAPGF